MGGLLRALSAGTLIVLYWPFFTVNEGFNGAESDFRFVLESGRSD